MAIIELSFASQATRTAVAAGRPPMALADALALSIVTFPIARPAAVAVAAGALACLAVQGAYRPSLTTKAAGGLRRLATAVAVPAVAVGAVFPDQAVEVLRLAPVALVALLVARFAVTLAARGTEPTPAVVIGAGKVGADLVKAIQERPALGLRPVGFLDSVDDPSLPLPLLGAAADLSEVVERTGARHVVVAYGAGDDTEVVAAVRAARDLDVEIWAVPRFFELGAVTSDAEEIWGVPLVRIPRRALRSNAWVLKRALDVVASGLGIALLSPVLAAIALAVKVTSPGPILFRQERVGQDGRTIEVLKFRSLRVNDDSSTQWNVTSDSRVTSIGRIIRPTSLDELPQLLNILRGDMTLVGPRPERPHFVQLFSETVPGYEERHRVPVGLTGLAQVNGLRGDTSIEDRARFDNRYIDGWSLWGDIVILARTVWTVLRPPASVKITAPVEPAAAEAPAEPVLLSA